MQPDQDRLRAIYRRVVPTIRQYQAGEMTWDAMISDFPDDEEFEDEDLSELLDLCEHEPNKRSWFPSGRVDRREWEQRVEELLRIVAAKGQPSR